MIGVTSQLSLVYKTRLCVLMNIHTTNVMSSDLTKQPGFFSQ